MADVLKKIAAYKADEVAHLKSTTSLTELRDLATRQTKPLGFASSIRRQSYIRPALITEVKKASPSKGVIRDDFNPVAIAQSYQAGGATCLSVLTDGPGFQGSNAIFKSVREAVTLPILRKDFMLDPIQIAESRVMGADCVLIIMAMINDKRAQALIDEATRHGMDALVETHDKTELKRAVDLGAKFIGINNRDLRTFKTTLKTFENLTQDVPDDVILIAESGIFTADDIVRLTHFGAQGFLIGESLMRQDNIMQATRSLSFT